MDEADRADDLIEMALTDAKTRMPRHSLEAVGECHYCGSDVPQGRRFCDAECRDAWEREQKLVSRKRRT